MLTRRVFIGSLLALSVLFLATGCHSTARSADGETVYFSDTAAFHRKLRKLPLTEKQAQTRLVKHLAEQQEQDYWSPYLVGIVGDSFLFSAPCKEKTVDLVGYYVDGHNGSVTFRDIPTGPRCVRPRFILLRK